MGNKQLGRRVKLGRCWAGKGGSICIE